MSLIQERLLLRPAFPVPQGVDETAVRRHLLQASNTEIGAVLGPIDRRICRIGLMGAGSTRANVLLFLTALERVLGHAGYRSAGPGAAAAAAEAAVAR